MTNSSRCASIRRSKTCCGALRGALGGVRASLTGEEAATYADWFDNWRIRLKNPASFSPGAIPEFRVRHSDPAAAEQVLALLFQRVMERLDGEARAKGSLSISASRFRVMPSALLDLLTTRLPAPLDARFGSLLTQPEHAGAWITVQREFQVDVRSSLDAIKTDTRRILEIQERELVRAREALEIAENDALAARGKAAQYRRRYRKLPADVSARKREPLRGSTGGPARIGRPRRSYASKPRKSKRQRAKWRATWLSSGASMTCASHGPKLCRSYRQAWQLDPDSSEYGISMRISPISKTASRMP